MSDYSEMTADEYRTELQKMFEEIQYTHVLRYFYIIVADSVKDEAWISRKGGASHE